MFLNSKLKLIACTFRKLQTFSQTTPKLFAIDVKQASKAHYTRTIVFQQSDFAPIRQTIMFRVGAQNVVYDV